MKVRLLDALGEPFRPRGIKSGSTLQVRIMVLLNIVFTRNAQLKYENPIYRNSNIMS